jgi:hypothetical protein
MSPEVKAEAVAFSYACGEAAEMLAEQVQKALNDKLCMCGCAETDALRRALERYKSASDGVCRIIGAGSLTEAFQAK